MATRAQATKEALKRLHAADKQFCRAFCREDLEPHVFDVVVVGGGPAGLAAAIEAARGGAEVLVVEQQLEAGRTLLKTGNGRCNVANKFVGPQHFNKGSYIEAVQAAFLQKCDGAGGGVAGGGVAGGGVAGGADGGVAGVAAQASTHNSITQAAITQGATPLGAELISWLHELGLVLAEESEGRLYPASFKAQSVQQALLTACERLGVTILLGATVDNITQATPSSTYTLALADALPERHLPACCQQLEARSVIWAVGGKGARALESLGHIYTPAQPCLCPLAIEEPFELADGCRTRAALTLMRKGNVIAREAGEVLFRRYGISGISVFQLSHLAEPGDTIILNVAPELSEQEAVAALLLMGPAAFVDEQLAFALLRCSKHAITTEKEALQVVRTLQHLELTVTGTADETHAQVTRGGICVLYFHPQTLASNRREGLFAAGEALDIDGLCGGYNLSWAWLSGIMAGTSAARFVVDTR